MSLTTNKLNPSTQSVAKTSADRNAVQQDVLEQSDKLVSELRAAEILLIGLPIYNFIMPAAFNMWIDLICHVGKTFNYTENGPVGSIVSKCVIVSVASGSVPIGSLIDPATPYLTEVFRFTNVTYVSTSSSAAALEGVIRVAED